MYPPFDTKSPAMPIRMNAKMSRAISAMRTRVAHKRDRSHVESRIDRSYWKSKSSEKLTEFDLHASGNGKYNGRPDADTGGSPAGSDSQCGDLQNENQNDEDELNDAQNERKFARKPRSPTRLML